MRPSSVSQSYPKSARLRTSAQYRWIQRTGQKLYSHHLSLQWTQTSSQRPARLGITVSAKYGPAVTRNRFKRIIKELFRLSYAHLLPGMAIHIRPGGRAKERVKLTHVNQVASFQELNQEWNELFNQAKLWKLPETSS